MHRIQFQIFKIVLSISSKNMKRSPITQQYKYNSTKLKIKLHLKSNLDIVSDFTMKIYEIT